MDLNVEREEWMLPECKGKTCRWLEKSVYMKGSDIENTVYREHWTSTFKDNHGCYLIEIVRTECKN